MKEKIQSIRGMRDLMGDEAFQYEKLTTIIKTALNNHGYQAFHPPILEKTQLFSRSLGEGTDVVEKEMFTFDDHGDSLTLRPEATAGIMRSVIQNGLNFGTHRLWTAGPMFRRERPQKGRYRQFHQLSVETIGVSEPEQEAEHLLMMYEIWKTLGITEFVQLKINTLANIASRNKYRDNLTAYFKDNFTHLDEDSQRRLTKNPMRILDSKNPKMQSIIEDAPKINQFLDDASKMHFERVINCLSTAKIPFEIDTTIVRGLDYYEHTVYEWVTNKLGSQSAICAGGRYDGLSEHLGNQLIPAVGFAIGLDRVMLLMQETESQVKQPKPIAYIITAGDSAKPMGLILANQIRQSVTDATVICNTASQSLKNQLKKANQSQADYAIIIGDEELAIQKASVKHLATGEQEAVDFDQLNNYFYHLKIKE